MPTDQAGRLHRIEHALNSTRQESDLIPTWDECDEAADRMYDAYWIQLHLQREKGKTEPGSIEALTFELIDQEVGTESWRQAERSLLRRASTSTTGPVQDALGVRLARFSWCWLHEYFSRDRARPTSITTGQNRTHPDRTRSVPN